MEYSPVDEPHADPMHRREMDYLRRLLRRSALRRCFVLRIEGDIGHWLSLSDSGGRYRPDVFKGLPVGVAQFRQSCVCDLT